MRYRKRKKAAAQVMVMTVAVVAVLAALLVLACSQVFRVRGILIVGNRNLSKEDVIALSGVQEGDNLFSISDAELKKNMERNRCIEYLGHEFDYRGTLSRSFRTTARLPSMLPAAACLPTSVGICWSP